MDNKTIQSVGDALRKLSEAAKDLLFEGIYNHKLLGKHMRYAIHAKKKRVRKKHFNIVMKTMNKMMKKILS